MEDTQQGSSLGHPFNVLFSPGKTFSQLAVKPSWLVPLILIMIIGVALTAVLMPAVDWDDVLLAEMEKNGTTVPEEQMDVMRSFTIGMAWAAAVVGPWVIYPGLALIFWLLFKVLGSDIGFKQSLSVVLHGYTPLWLVASVLSIPVILSLGELTIEQVQGSTYLMSNLGLLANEETSLALRTFLGSIDLFSLWSIVLLTLGFRGVARVSTGKAASVVLVLWSLYIAAKVGVQMVIG